MVAAKTELPEDAMASLDQRVTMHGMTWWQYETLLAVRGESAVPRITYLEGTIELMSPSQNHEAIKKRIARLLEHWVVLNGVPLQGYGSWTIKSAPDERGAEPDECYILGMAPQEYPDIAIEVAISSGGLNKLEVYRKLSVREVWMWRGKRIEVFALRGDDYEPAPRSEILPDLDLELFYSFVLRHDQLEAARDYAQALGKKLP